MVNVLLSQENGSGVKVYMVQVSKLAQHVESYGGEFLL